MATSTYDALYTYTFPSNGASYTFSNIYQTYKDLVLEINGTTSSAVTISMILNNDTSAKYSCIETYSDATSKNGTGNTNQTELSIASNVAQIGSTYEFMSQIHLNSYTNTSILKPILARTSAWGSINNQISGCYNSTSAITSITIRGYAGASGFTAGTTMTLYGIVG